MGIEMPGLKHHGFNQSSGAWTQRGFEQCLVLKCHICCFAIEHHTAGVWAETSFSFPCPFWSTGPCASSALQRSPQIVLTSPYCSPASFQLSKPGWTSAFEHCCSSIGLKDYWVSCMLQQGSALRLALQYRESAHAWSTWEVHDSGWECNKLDMQEAFRQVCVWLWGVTHPWFVMPIFLCVLKAE